MEKKIHKVELSTLWFSAGGTVFIVQHGKQNFIKWKLGARPLQKVLENIRQTPNSSRKAEMVIQRMGWSAWHRHEMALGFSCRHLASKVRGYSLGRESLTEAACPRKDWWTRTTKTIAASCPVGNAKLVWRAVQTLVDSPCCSCNADCKRHGCCTALRGEGSARTVCP